MKWLAAERFRKLAALAARREAARVEGVELRLDGWLERKDGWLEERVALDAVALDAELRERRPEPRDEGTYGEERKLAGVRARATSAYSPSYSLGPVN